MKDEQKEDHYLEVFIGTTYDIGVPKTVGELRTKLEEIAADLPKDDSLKIADVDLGDRTLNYTLTDVIYL